MECTSHLSELKEKIESMQISQDQKVSDPLSCYDGGSLSDTNISIRHFLSRLVHKIPKNILQRKQYSHFNFRLLSQLLIAQGFYSKIHKHESREEFSDETMIGLQYCYEEIIKTILVTTAILVTEPEFSRPLSIRLEKNEKTGNFEIIEKIESQLLTMQLVARSPEVFVSEDVDRKRVVKVCNDSAYQIINDTTRIFMKTLDRLFRVKISEERLNVYEQYLPINLFQSDYKHLFFESRKPKGTGDDGLVAAPMVLARRCHVKTEDEITNIIKEIQLEIFTFLENILKVFLSLRNQVCVQQKVNVKNKSRVRLYA